MPDLGALTPSLERAIAADLFNQVWALLGEADRTPQDDELMVHAAHASRYHWGRVGESKHLAIGEWQIARVYSVLGLHEASLRHARRSVEIADSVGEESAWVLASAQEGLARALMGAGELDEAQSWRAKAWQQLSKVSDAEDREIVAQDLREHELT